MTTAVSQHNVPNAHREERWENQAAKPRTRRILIVSPHFPPSNLAAVHRARLFARHLPEFGWEPIILTVHHAFYEERLDWALTKLVPKSLRIERVRALPTRPIRLIGDIGIRGFLALCRRSIELIDELEIDFLYIPIPSFYAAPLGRVLHAFRGIPYGIDYIDPWVHAWPPGKRRFFSKYWASWKLGALLEPFSVRHASLITGVAPGYYAGVLDRNPSLAARVVTAAMPYGGDESDHEAVRESGLSPYLFDPRDGRRHLVYAGALLPRSFAALDQILCSIAANREQFQSTTFHFVGTGKSPDDLHGYNVRALAERYGLWGDIIAEHPPRIPYLDVLVHLHAADGVFILGSTEAHYTPSKVFQGVLAGKPILAVLHERSTACTVLRQTGVGHVLAMRGESDVETLSHSFPVAFEEFCNFAARFDPARVDRSRFEPFTARSSTRTLARAIDEALARQSREPLLTEGQCDA